MTTTSPARTDGVIDPLSTTSERQPTSSGTNDQTTSQTRQDIADCATSRTPPTRRARPSRRTGCAGAVGAGWDTSCPVIVTSPGSQVDQVDQVLWASHVKPMPADLFCALLSSCSV